MIEKRGEEKNKLSNADRKIRSKNYIIALYSRLIPYGPLVYGYFRARR